MARQIQEGLEALSHELDALLQELTQTSLVIEAELRPVFLLFAALDHAQCGSLSQGGAFWDSPIAVEILRRLTDPEHRPALRQWYRRGPLNPEAEELRIRLSALIRETL